MTIDFRKACINPLPQAFRIEIDGHPVRTPGKNLLELPTKALADAVLAEWRVQEDKADPQVMPYTRFSNSAIDHVRPRRDAVVAEVTNYGEADLLCYRVANPQDLKERQTERWQPLLDWLAVEKDCALIHTENALPVAQPEDAIAALQNNVRALADFPLAGLYALATTTGSVTIALALLHKHIDPDTAWSAAFLDEQYQAEKWGEDDDTKNRLERMRTEIELATAFSELSSLE